MTLDGHRVILNKCRQEKLQGKYVQLPFSQQKTKTLVGLFGATAHPRFVVAVDHNAWWRHQMETFSALLALCEGNSPVTGEFPSQRLATRNFGVWFETPSGSLWRHCSEPRQFAYSWNEGNQPLLRPNMPSPYPPHYLPGTSIRKHGNTHARTHRIIETEHGHVHSGRQGFYIHGIK